MKSRFSVKARALAAMLAILFLFNGINIYIDVSADEVTYDGNTLRDGR